MEEKISGEKKGYIWFGSVDVNSNFMDNNFDPIILLTFSFVRWSLFSLIVRNISKKCKKKIGKMSTRAFFTSFADELLCFAPFMVIAAMEILLNMP